MFMQAFGVETAKTAVHINYNLCYLYTTADKNNTITVSAHKKNKAGQVSDIHNIPHSPMLQLYIFSGNLLQDNVQMYF